MVYPQEFSAEARTRIEAERVKANQALRQARTVEPPDNWTKGKRVWDECAFRGYILRVFRAYAHEACELGKQGTWAGDRIRSETDEFLRRFAIEACDEQGHDRYGDKFRMIVSDWYTSLRPEVERWFHESDEWREFEDDLLAVAERQAAQKSEPGGDEPAQTEAGPAGNGTNNATGRREAVDAYIEEVFSRTGKRITRTDIWKSARYKSRTEFERWERNDRRATKTADQRFTRILSEKPHLK